MDNTNTRRREAHLLRGKVGLRINGDHGHPTPMRTIRSETVSGQGRGHLRDEAGLQFGHGSPEILGSMRVLPYMVPHYAYIAEPLYGLLKKGRKFEWSKEHTESVRKMKEALAATPALRKAVYGVTLLRACV